ncbi:MAG: hypothetical protein ABI877_09025, partial [Gemmatimonadaceae bacterium]
GVMGMSAGGHLAMMAGVTSDSTLLGLSLGCKGRRSDVKAVVSLYGPADLIAIPPQLAVNGCARDPMMDSSLMKVLGLTTLTTAQDSIKVASFSPVNNIRRVVPLAMWNGDVDCIVPFQQMTNMQRAMALRGGVVQVNIAHGFAHGIQDSTIADSASGFLYARLSH